MTYKRTISRKIVRLISHDDNVKANILPIDSLFWMDTSKEKVKVLLFLETNKYLEGKESGNFTIYRPFSPCKRTDRVAML